MAGLRTKLICLGWLASIVLAMAPFGAGHAASGTVKYTYDGLGRLTKTQYGANTTDPTVQYSYDPAGNRTNVGITNSTAQVAPVAGADAISTHMNTATTFDPRTNDSDANGDTLTITAKTDGAHGTVVIVSAGTQLTYTPATSYVGSDSFTYTISDGHGNTAVGTVTATVGNNAPVAVADTISTPVNVAVTFNPWSNDTDADGDTLTITAKTDGAHGAVAIVSAGTQLTYTPTAGYAGADSFTYTISDGFGGTAIGTVNATVTSASTTVYSIANATGTEASPSTVIFTVSRTGTPIASEAINYAMGSPGTAISGTDYTAASNTLTFGTSDTSKTFSVLVTSDTIYEGSETFTATLSGNTAGTIGTATATGTITDNDTAPSFSIGNASATEGSSVVFTVTKTGSTAFSHAVNYATSGGTATSGTDFTAKSGTLTFTSGQTSQTVSVTTTNDTTIESNETFSMALSGATNGATIGTATRTGTIIDNDSPIVLTNADGTLTAAAGTTYAKSGPNCTWDSFLNLTTCSYSLALTSNSGVVYSGVNFNGGSYTTTQLSTGYSNVDLVVTVDAAHFGVGP